MREKLKHGIVIGSALVAAVGVADRAWSATAAVPTAGVAVTSILVGAAGATESGLDDTRSKWNRRVLGFLSIVVLTADPDPATYLSGTSVFAFPDELLEFTGLTWYGPFSDMSTGDTGPVAGPDAIQGSGFVDDVQLFKPQAPNPFLDITTTVIDGKLTVSWTANPGIEAASTSVNMFGAAFTNISGRDLPFAITPPGSPSANLYQITSAQSLVCIPPGEKIPRGCGYPDEPIRFAIIPEPATLTLFAIGLTGFAASRKQKRKSLREN